MKTKVTAFIVLVIMQSVFCEPYPPYREIAGAFSTFEKTRNGQSRLDIHGETIKNITTVFSPDAKEITVEITEGGVGYSYVNFSYEVPPEGEGTFNTYILTRETDFVADVSNYLSSQSDVWLGYLAIYNASNTSRTDLFSFAFDRESCTCAGDSEWVYGIGSREIKGGYPNNYFDLVLDIPEGVVAQSGHACGYPNIDLGSRNASPLPHLIKANYTLALYQLYDTIAYTTTPVQLTRKYDLREIVSYEGGIEWINGTGVWNIIGGGPGFEYISYNSSHDAYTWGIVDFNFTVMYPLEQDINHN